MTIEIDSASGFCFGVVTAIHKAEEELRSSGALYCLGDIVHNSDEVERLRRQGLVTIDHDDMSRLHDVKVLLRAHGEPPSTSTYDADPSSQIVIYGKMGHAEVNGLVGQTDGKAIVIEDSDDLDKIDYGRDITLYSQTTKSLEGFRHIITLIKERVKPGVQFTYADTICRQVSSRVGHLRDFAAAHEVVLFVAGMKSSNGRILYDQCRQVNPRTYHIANADAVSGRWLTGAESIGICGATSTPRWLMEQVRDSVASLVAQQQSEEVVDE